MCKLKNSRQCKASVPHRGCNRPPARSALCSLLRSAVCLHILSRGGGFTCRSISMDGGARTWISGEVHRTESKDEPENIIHVRLGWDIIAKVFKHCSCSYGFEYVSFICSHKERRSCLTKQLITNIRLEGLCTDDQLDWCDSIHVPKKGNIASPTHASTPQHQLFWYFESDIRERTLSQCAYSERSCQVYLCIHQSRIEVSRREAHDGGSSHCCALYFCIDMVSTYCTILQGCQRRLTQVHWPDGHPHLVPQLQEHPGAIQVR